MNRSGSSSRVRVGHHLPRCANFGTSALFPRACGASERVIKELQDVGFFCTQHPQFQQTKTEPIKRLMRIPDPEVKEKAISTIEKSLDHGLSPVTGKFTGQRELLAAANCCDMLRFFRSENESQYSRVLCVNSVNYVPTLPTLFRGPENSTQLTLFYYPFAEGKKG